MKNFIKGFSGIFNIAGSRRKIEELPVILDDRAALKSDWEAIGNDMKTAMGLLKRKVRKS